jgi:hypothetical protein
VQHTKHLHLASKADVNRRHRIYLGVDEQLITEVTDHRSNAVRNYKRTTTAQKRKISEVIQGSSDGNNNSPTAKCANSKIAGMESYEQWEKGRS